MKGIVFSEIFGPPNFKALIIDPLYISYDMYRGFYYLKKLFNTGSSVVIDDFSSLRINGPYALLNLGPNFATIKCDDYTVEAVGRRFNCR